MKPNNAASAATSQNPSPLVTTDKGAVPQITPGISGRKVAWGLAAFMLFSLIAIPLGLFVYQGVSNQEKQIQRDWPSVAADLELSYQALDRAWENASKSSTELAKAHETWKTARQLFRLQRQWWEQIVAAQVLEGLLSLRTIEDASLYIDSLAKHTSDENERKQLRDARVAAIKKYQKFETDQLLPYQAALNEFPSNSVLLFFKLPQSSSLRFTDSKLLK